MVSGHDDGIGRGAWHEVSAYFTGDGASGMIVNCEVAQGRAMPARRWRDMVNLPVRDVSVPVPPGVGEVDHHGVAGKGAGDPGQGGLG